MLFLFPTAQVQTVHRARIAANARHEGSHARVANGVVCGSHDVETKLARLRSLIWNNP